MTDITTLGLYELRRGLDEKKFSSTELTKACLDRIKQHQDLNTFITLAEDEVLREAEAADAEIATGSSKPLLGIPIAVKDVILTKGLRTTAASRILANFIPPYDATSVIKIRDAGALVIGKTNLDEFAMGASNESSAFGPCLNAWDKTRVSGGSSGGSAVAVSARLVPAALGTDTGGSIRQPASFCGVVGLRPSYGRVSRYGVIAYASSFDQVGSFANNVRDCALMSKIIAGHDPHDSTTLPVPVPDYTEVLNKGVKGLRVGMPKEYFTEGADPEVNAAVRAAIKKLEELGASIVEISLPHTEASIPTYYILVPAEASSNLARYDGVRYGHRAEKPEDLMDLYCRSRSEGFGEEVQRRIMIGSYVLSAGYYDAYYRKAQKVRALIANDFQKAFASHCDVIACPVSPTTAFKVGEKMDDPIQLYLCDVFTGPVNLAGTAGLSVPCGFDSKGLPIGLQLICKPFDEASLFQVAAAYEEATEWHNRAPLEGE